MFPAPTGGGFATSESDTAPAPRLWSLGAGVSDY
ncbi:hypothetical protein MGAST_25480 [Mycobacterium gastri 'Wayne']|nr:hypothetical protein MGAST_25480 [Mycobacterium gastri 'Wayne']